MKKLSFTTAPRLRTLEGSCGSTSPIEGCPGRGRKAGRLNKTKIRLLLLKFLLVLPRCYHWKQGCNRRFWTLWYHCLGIEALVDHLVPRQGRSGRIGSVLVEISSLGLSQEPPCTFRSEGKTQPHSKRAFYWTDLAEFSSENLPETFFILHIAYHFQKTGNCNHLFSCSRGIRDTSCCATIVRL